MPTYSRHIQDWFCVHSFTHQVAKNGCLRYQLVRRRIVNPWPSRLVGLVVRIQCRHSYSYFLNHVLLEKGGKYLVVTTLC